MARTCRLCGAEKRAREFEGSWRVCRTCTNEQARLRYHGARQCDVHLVKPAGADCVNVGTETFSATCDCGHAIAGMACKSCMAADLLGCLTCWEAGKPHRCPVTFAEAALAGVAS